MDSLEDFLSQEEMMSWLKENNLEPETFCLAPYIMTDLDQDGSVLTCYRGKTRLDNWKKNPFDNSFNGPEMKKIRSDLFKGIKNTNCRSCYAAEKNGSLSPRINLFNDFFFKTYGDRLDNIIEKIKKDPLSGNVKDIVRSEIRPSSLCNQRCMHCGPHSSTKWIETLAKQENYNLYSENQEILDKGLGPIDSSHITNKNIVTHYKGSLTSDTKYKKDILELLNSSSEIAFTGGEPLLTPEHLEYLNYFVNVTGNSKNQLLSYSSNLNIKNIERFFDYWKDFKKVNIRVSIDASFNTYEYFRTFGDVNLIKENIRKIQNFSDNDQNNIKIEIMASITFSMFSALRWKEIIKDWSDYSLPFHASLIMDHPVSVKYMPKKLSEKALDDMQWCIDNVKKYYSDKDNITKFIHHTTNCMNYIQGFDNQFNNLPDFVVKYIKFCDITSGNDVLNYYPELKEYI